jgi:hypothetical protein
MSNPTDSKRFVGFAAVKLGDLDGVTCCAACDGELREVWGNENGVEVCVKTPLEDQLVEAHSKFKSATSTTEHFLPLLRHCLQLDRNGLDSVVVGPE